MLYKIKWMSMRWCYKQTFYFTIYGDGLGKLSDSLNILISDILPFCHFQQIRSCSLYKPVQSWQSDIKPRYKKPVCPHNWWPLIFGNDNKLSRGEGGLHTINQFSPATFLCLSKSKARISIEIWHVMAF